MNQIDLCLKIATEAHRDQLDRSGDPVILHPLTVGLMGRNEGEKCVGFLHDVIEDTDIWSQPWSYFLLGILSALGPIQASLVSALACENFGLQAQEHSELSD